MKKLALILLFFTSTFSYAQEIEKVEKKVDEVSKNQKETDKKVDDLSEKLETFKTKLSELETNKSSKVASIRLKTKTLDRRIDDEKFDAQVSIDSVVVIAHDGVITDIQVICKDQLFTNKRAPISLTGKRVNGKDRLFEGRDEYYLEIGDVVQFVSLKSFAPDDTTFTLRKENDMIFLTRGSSINTVFDIRVYSDAFGLFGGKANGLVQTDARFRQVLNRANWANSGVFFFNYFKANFSLSKFDSKVASVSEEGFSRTELYQKSWLTAEVALNFANIPLAGKSLHYAYADVGAGLNVAKFKPSEGDSIDITAPYLFLEPGLNMRFSENFGACLSVRMMFQYATQIDIEDQGGVRKFLKPGFEIYWIPDDKKASKLFGRFGYVVDTDEKEENFSIFQFGYSVTLTSLVKK